MNTRISRLLVIATLLVHSCSTDFDLTADWKEITIVYGLLNVRDSVQYIKINKAFLDENTNALVIAQRRDSLYHKGDLTVKLEEWDDNNLLNTYSLIKVDANSEIGQKDTGIFANSPNYLYKLSNPINKDYAYKLVIQTNSGKTIAAQTSVVDTIKVTRPRQTILYNPLAISPAGRRVEWKTAKNAIIYELTIRFHYKEISLITLDTVAKFVDWKVFGNFKSDDANLSEEFELPEGGFLNFVCGQIGGSKSNVVRKVGNLDFIFYAGGETLSMYIDVIDAQSGLTSGQIHPEFTNVEGGIGIFSSRSFTIVKNIGLAAQAIDSLVNAPSYCDIDFIE